MLYERSVLFFNFSVSQADKQGVAEYKKPTHDTFTWNRIIKGEKSLFIPDRAKVNLRSESSWSGKRERNRFDLQGRRTSLITNQFVLSAIYCRFLNLVTLPSRERKR
jgi:hypothetical protein